MKILIAIYSHPEFYPPTLNAIEELSKVADEIVVLSRNVKATEWKYPAQVKIKISGKFTPINVIQHASTLRKCYSFIGFTFYFLRLLHKLKPDWVICYDAIPLLAFRVAKVFSFSQSKLWYHNHDVMEQNHSKYSVSRWAAMSENNFFHAIDLFSLPSEERAVYFPTYKLKKNYFIIPNYPSKIRFNLKSKEQPGEELKLIYQGYIDYGHGLEEFIHYLSFDSSISLTIIGPGNQEYLNKLDELIKEKNLKKQVYLRPAVSYNELIQITQTHHIGIATHLPICIGYKTAAKASNKIYEYAALGLPIFYYNSEHYVNHLSKYKWAVETDLSTEDICDKIRFIRNNYKFLSSSALNDFQTNLNFGKVFEPIFSQLIMENHNN